MKVIGSICLLSLTMASCSKVKYAHGKRTYEAICASCHMDDGSGVEDLYPSLVNNLKLTDLQYLSCTIRHGKSTEASLIKMPSNPALKDVDITNIINYILVDLNHQGDEVQMKNISALLKECTTDEEIR